MAFPRPGPAVSMRAYVVAGIVATVCGVSHAQAPTLSFPTAIVTDVRLRNYMCSQQRPISVAYVATADGDAFAYLAVEGRPHIFVSVLADLGVKYVTGPYVWWTNGATARLLRTDDPQVPLLDDCTIVAEPVKRPSTPASIGNSTAPIEAPRDSAALRPPRRTRAAAPASD